MSKQIIASSGNVNTEIVQKSNANFTELYTLVESTGDLLFDKPFGRRYGTWDTPVTGDLVIDETGAQDGYCVVVVWSGATTPNVIGGVRGCVTGSIDEQAIYNIYFNRIDGMYNVNILKQSTATATAPTITATQDIDSVITVTNPSVLEFDTLLGYNNYSDIDGQLGTMMTPTEATNGHTVALSDGVVHEVTSKPVGTTNGEFSAVVSNAVSVDLSGGDSLLFDDFSGTVIDTAKWTVTNPDIPAVSITQNNNLICTGDGTSTGTSGDLYANKIISVDTFDATGILVMRFDISRGNAPSSGENGMVIGMGLGTHADSIVFQRVNNDASSVQIIIKEGDDNTYVATETVDYDGSHKIVKLANGDVSYHKWSGSAWVQYGVTTSTGYTTGTLVSQMTCTAGADSQIFNIDNLYITDSDFAGLTP